MRTNTNGKRVFVVAVIIITILGVALLWSSKPKTPGERFREALQKIEKACASRQLNPNEQCGEVAKLKPADPLATPEGRFAHAIKLPAPLPEDSGYREGMTPREYFDHLCETEAGEFIYRVVENVESVFLLRPRASSGYLHNHLFAPEAPFLLTDDKRTPWALIGPGRYHAVETTHSLLPSLGSRESSDPSSGVSNHSNSKTDSYLRYQDYDGKTADTMREAHVSERNSKYGFTWRGITRPNDREMGVGGGEFIVIDLETQAVLALLRGYVRFDIGKVAGVSGLHWLQRCPVPSADASRQESDFLLKVLRPRVK